MSRTAFYLGVSLLGWLGSPAVAQTLEVEPLSEAAIPNWLIIVLALLLAVAVVIPSFKSSKRTHQD